MNIENKLNYFGHTLNYYMHQNSLMWGRLNHCFAIQVVTIGGSYAIKSAVFTPVLLCIGALVSMCFILMFNRDRQIRNEHSKLMLELADSIDKETGDEILEKFNVKVPPSGWAPVEAGSIFRFTLGLIVILKVVFALVVAVWPEVLSWL